MGVDWSLILEFCKVILAWPVCTVLIILFLSIYFKDPITKWLSRLKIEYGGATLTSQQPTEISSGANLPSPSVPKADTNDEFVRSLETKNIDELKELIVQWRANAYIWEYQYLNRFLVYNSRKVLCWFYDINRSLNIELVDAFWKTQIPDTDELGAILTALKNHYLVEFYSGQISITPKGREYIEHFGRVPIVPATLSSEAAKEAKPETT